MRTTVEVARFRGEKRIEIDAVIPGRLNYIQVKRWLVRQEEAG